jgi:DNA replication and repair protein RecF
MSEISRLNISAIRNISSADINPCPTTNLIWGDNGSGKTSILESIHLLATGRSFRSNKIGSLIAHNSLEAVVFVELADGSQIGLSKARKQANLLKFQNEAQSNWESVARVIPVQVLDSNSFQLLEGGPKARRRFMDWGVFHVEPSFVINWRTVSKCIANRNFLLRQRQLDSDQLAAWDAELVQAAISVDKARSTYLQSLLPAFTDVYTALRGAAADELELKYDSGWDSNTDYASVLKTSLDTDSRYGATQNGPHRADIRVRIGNVPSIEVLSRGQQKILVSSLKIAQARLLTESTGRKCVYLVDDLPSELDRANRVAVLQMLMGLGGQLFVTCIELESIKADLDPRQMTVFHVERGIITA